MEDELQRLRKELNELQRKREEEQRQREDEQRLREDEKRLRLAAESRAIEEQRRREGAEQRASEIPPRRIIPWDSFAHEQEKSWEQISLCPSFFSQAVFPSPHQLEYVRSLLSPISSETGLRNSERDTVENAVQKLFQAAHTNLGGREESVAESLEQVSISSTARSRSRQTRKARGKGGQADQFCIHHFSNDVRIPASATEYKPPHKLMRNEFVTGLASEIRPDRDVINQEAEGFEFAAQRLTAAVVTQLLSYMVGKGIRYGYITQGEAYVFLSIPRNDPTCIHFAVCVPRLDVQDSTNGDGNTRLYRTAVAQVFAFLLRAVQASPPTQTWHRMAEELDTWAIEYDDVLKSIPTTVRKEKRETPYKPQRWKGFTRSPVRTRSHCLPPDSEKQLPDSSSSDGDDDDSPSPTPNPASRSLNGRVVSNAATSTESPSQQGAGQTTDQRQSIQERPYCTNECLRGLACGGSMDLQCPNFGDHDSHHISLEKLLRLVRHQLLVDCGDNADCVPLHLSGAHGSLFKLCLSSHGYTLVAKGVEWTDVARLQHENHLYDHLQSLQGVCIPVCLGTIDLIEPYYYDSGAYEHFMLMSYGGRPILKELAKVKPGVVEKALTALGRLHQQKVLHRDAEPRNVLYDTSTGNCMIVDLMLAEVRQRQALGPIRINGQDRKRKWAAVKRGNDDFIIEAQSLRANLMPRGL